LYKEFNACNTYSKYRLETNGIRFLFKRKAGIHIICDRNSYQSWADFTSYKTWIHIICE